MHVIHCRQLTRITPEGALLHRDRVVDAYKAICHQRRGDFIAPAFEIERGSTYGRQHHVIRGTMIHVTVEKERKIDNRRILCQENIAKSLDNDSVGPQPTIFCVLKMERVHAENVAGPLRFLFANLRKSLRGIVDSTTVPPIGHEYDGHFRSGSHVSHECAAAAQHLVIHVRRQHNHGFRTWITDARGLIVKVAADQSVQATQTPMTRYCLQNSLQDHRGGAGVTRTVTALDPALIGAEDRGRPTSRAVVGET